jgi:peptidoglycan-N-acetylglucosamine deacetylase
MNSGWATRLARSQGRVAQLTSHLAPTLVTGPIDRAFTDAATSWNGRRSCLLLSFDVDFPEDCDALPRVAERLTAHGLTASFACVGRWVEEFPDEHGAVLNSGHELVNHSYSHPELVNAPGRFVSRRSDLNERRWEDLSLAERQDEIGRCQQAVFDTLGVTMRGFRAPHFGNVDPMPLYPLLSAGGFVYSTSMLAPRGPHFGLPVVAQGVVEIPVTTCPRHPLSSLDTWHAFYARDGWHADDFGKLLEMQLRRAVHSTGITNIYLDPKDIERFDFDRFLEQARALGDDCWIATYGDFADWYRQQDATAQ